MNKRIIIHNPFYEDWFGNFNLYKFLTRRKSHPKYSYIFEYFIKNRKHNVIIYIDLSQNSFINNKKLHKLKLTHLVTLVEFFLWCLLNRVNIFKQKIIFNLNYIRSEDIFLSNSYHNLDINERVSYLEPLKSIKTAFILQHSFADTEFISLNAKKLNIDYLIAENNLSKNSAYFKKYFKWYEKDIYHIPYVFKSRFKNIKPFKDRKNICFATGSFEHLSDHPRYSTFKKFFNTQTIHPMRKIIYDNLDELKDLINSKISDLYKDEVERLHEGENLFQKIYARLFNAMFVKQSNYHKFDIVAEYNDAKMFVVPEEANDLPGIGFVEGMACGSAYIGLDDRMYKDIGLIPGKHYITYDGTLEDLKSKIIYYQKNNDELEAIALAGCNFVRKNFNGNSVAKKFYNDLLSDELKSSFTK